MFILASVAMGKCEMGGMWALLEQRHSPVCAMWNNPSHNSTSPTGPVPRMELKIHGPVTVNVGRLEAPHLHMAG